MIFRMLLVALISLFLWQCALRDQQVEKDVSEKECEVEDLDLSTIDDVTTLIAKEAEIQKDK